MGKNGLFAVVLVLLLGTGIVACEQQEEATGLPETASTGADKEKPADMPDTVIPIHTTEYAIEAPKTLQLGWNTFRFTNNGKQAHFVWMYRIADGKTVEDQLNEVVPAFDAVMNGLRSGEMSKADIGPYLGENLPEWAFAMTGVGGTGLLAPGHTAESSFQLTEPGTYLIECYVKGPNGMFHSAMGMLAQVDVPDVQGNGVEPAADATITLGKAGVEAPDMLQAGKHTFRVVFSEDPEGFVPYDLHLAKIDDATVLEDVTYWMDWTNVGGLQAPAPAIFLGGLENLHAAPKGTGYGYFAADLEPGRYLWISEVSPKTMNRTFIVE